MLGLSPNSNYSPGPQCNLPLGLPTVCSSFQLVCQGIPTAVCPHDTCVWNLPWLQLLAWCGLCLKFLADHTTSATAACCDAACPQDSPWSEPPPTGLPRKPQCGLSLDLPTARTHQNYNFAQPTMVAPVQPNPRTTNNLSWLQVHLLLAHSSSSQPAYMALVWSPSSLCPFRVQLACQIQPAHTFYKGKAPAQGYSLETWKGCCFA